MINLSELIPIKLADIELRDLFAILATKDDIENYLPGINKSFIANETIQAAKYQYADDMLKARNKKT